MRNIAGNTTALLAAAVILGLTGCTQAASSQPVSDTFKVETVAEKVITVQAVEKVKVTPDIAEIVFAVSTQAADAKSCQEKNAEDLATVITFLKGTGIEQQSIQTSNYGLNPVYDWNSGRTITGYEMQTNITVSDIPIDKTGELLSSCVEAGINNIQNVTYLSSQYDTSYQQALSGAIEAAKVKANTLAQASGCILGPVVKVEEFTANQQARYTGYQNYSAAKEDALEAAPMAVEPGQLTITAQISVDFEIQ